MRVALFVLAHISLFLFIVYGFGKFQKAMFHSDETWVIVWVVLIMSAYLASSEVYYQFRKYYRFVNLKKKRGVQTVRQADIRRVTEVRSTTHSSGLTLHSTSTHEPDDDDAGA